MHTSNVNVDAVRDMLEERSRAGRDAVEAAGELRFQKDLQVMQGLLSNQTRDEMLYVIDTWLAEQVEVPIEDFRSYSMVSEEYARFLGERVSLELPNDPMAMIDKAWREWREKGSRV